jgi:type IV pilus assembly protein PilM
MSASSVVGLDIGSSQIKAVHLERRRNQWTLARAGIVPTPEEAVQDGVVLDIDRVKEGVRQLISEHGFPLADTVAAVSGSHVLVRSVKMPDMNSANLKRSIRFEAARHVEQGGVSLDACALEFEVVGRSGDPPQLDVLLVVAPLPMVNGRLSVVEGAGLEPVAVDVEAFALLRALKAAARLPGPGQGTIVMEMGASYTNLNIIVGEQVVVTRSLPIGGNALTASLASALNIPPQEAEEYKREIQLEAPSPRGDGGDYYAEAPDPARQTAVPFVDELVRELRRSILYFQSQAAEAGVEIEIDRLILAGGGTQLGGLQGYLSDRLGLQVSQLNPLENVSLSEQLVAWQDRGAELAVAVGLAMKEYN